MVIVSLHVEPYVVTSTQYSVVSVGETVMFSDVSPVDHIYELASQIVVLSFVKLTYPEGKVPS